MAITTPMIIFRFLLFGVGDGVGAGVTIGLGVIFVYGPTGVGGNGGDGGDGPGGDGPGGDTGLGTDGGGADGVRATVLLTGRSGIKRGASE